MTGAEKRTAALDADRERRRRPIRHGVVAGLRLTAERRLAGCRVGEPIAGCLNVRAVGPRPPVSGYAVPPGESGTAWLRLDGRLLLLAGEGDWGARVRRLVPYASWLQGLPLLHAAAVEADGSALALIGRSEIGKSTLSRLLCRHGYRARYEDLTPCRTGGEGYVIPSSNRSAAPLGALVFVARVHRRRPATEPLSPASAVRWLARNGWGDLALADLWRAQFDFYTELAAATPAARLLMPDDRSRLQESVAAAAVLLSGL